MGKDFLGIEELSEPGFSVRVPPLENVPMTRRMAGLVDTCEFQRLRKVKQLSLTHLVFPGANHTRFEHSLGVFNLARSYLLHLVEVPRFRELVTEKQALSLLLAALLHDIGHYPYGHIVEGVNPDLTLHEVRGQQIVANITFSALMGEFDIDPVYVGRLIAGDDEGLAESEKVPFRLLRDLLDSAVDADKMDYLERDSIHCGVPYGRSYDKERLIGALTVSKDNRLALTDKGKASAEYVIFSRYVMLTEVYWHHTVRAASVMLIRCLQEAAGFHRWPEFLQALMGAMGDDEALHGLSEVVKDDPDALGLLRGIRNRSLYKRVRTYSPLDPDSAEVFGHLAKLQGPVDGKKLSLVLEEALGAPRMHILADIVPAKHIADDLTVFYPKRGQYRSLNQISPIVHAISSTWQNLTGIVRIYAHPAWAEKLMGMGDEIDKLILSCKINI